MKNFFYEFVFGKNPLISGIIAIGVVASVALGCNCGKNLDLANLSQGSNSTSNTNSTNAQADSSVPSNLVVEGLVKETMSEFADAVDKKDFSSLYENASQDFQSSYTLDQISTAFKTYTDKKSVVVPILRKIPALDANFTDPPSIRTEKRLNILIAKGEFATKPFKTRFDYEYVMRDGEWKLLKLIINIP